MYRGLRDCDFLYQHYTCTYQLYTLVDTSLT